MANDRFEEIPATTTLEDLAKHNRNWDKADAELTAQQNDYNGKITAEQQVRASSDSNLQTQITAEQQARITAVSAHINAIAAHAAAAITLNPVTGLTANNLQTAVEQLRTMLTTIIAGPAPSAAEIQAARVGADNVARASLDILIKEIHAKLIAANNQTNSLVHGQNVITASEAGPVAVTVKGNTLVSILRVGNFETDSNGDGIADGWGKLNALGTHSLETTGVMYGTKAQRITALAGDSAASRGIALDGAYRPALYAGRYYLFLVHATTDGGASTNAYIRLDDGGDSFVVLSPQSNVTKTHCVKVAPVSDIASARLFLYNAAPVGSTNWVQYDGARIVEVDAATYALVNVDPEYTGEKLAARYPYVDGVKHIINPVITKIGKNILPSVPQTIHSNLSVVEPYYLVLNATGANQLSSVEVDVLPNSQYFIKSEITASTGQGYINYYAISSSGVSTYLGEINTVSLLAKAITTPANCVKLRVVFNNTTAGIFTYKNFQLEIGSSATPFEPRNDDYLYALTTLAGYGGVNDVLTVRGTEATVLRRWKTDVILDGSLAWEYHDDEVGFKKIRINILNSTTYLAANGYMTKNDLSPLMRRTPSGGIWAEDMFQIGSSNSNVYIAVSDSKSGWGETYAPSSDEVKAWANGWRMNNGTFGQPYNGTGTKTWTRWDATSNTGAVITVPTTIAEGYTPYKLSYQLATPVTEVVPVEGSLANHAGANLYEVGEGIVVREKVIAPKLDGGRYYITSSDAPAYWGDARVKRPASLLMRVYKNAIHDANWINISSPTAISVPAALFDPTAEYTATYLARDKYLLTAPVVEGALEYNTSSKMVQDTLVQRMADVETGMNINVNAIAELYRRVRALGGV